MHCSHPLKLPTTSGNVGDGLPTSTTDFIDVTGLAGVETGGSNSVSVVLRSGGSTGPVVATLVCSSGSVGSSPTPINHAVRCNAPLYAEILGSGTIDGAVQIL